MKTIKEPKVKYIRNTQDLKLKKLKKHFNKNVDIYIGKKITPQTLELFFNRSTFEDNDCFLLHYHRPQRWSAILRDIGIAKSTSEAGGAGWNRMVEDGFQTIYLDGLKVWKGEGFGKIPHRITILNEKEKTY